MLLDTNSLSIKGYWIKTYYSLAICVIKGMFNL